MCTQAKYSNYQKKAIKFLYSYLGVGIPFDYERTQSNHLKVLIEGVKSPIYTGSTPSDRKSINNFMAEVKRAVRAINQSDDHTEGNVANKELESLEITSHAKLIETCIKSIRLRLDTIKSKEEIQVLAKKSIDEVKVYRSNTIKQTLSFVLKARKNGMYIKPKEMKEIETKVSQHLDFLLPTRAHYANLLKNNEKHLVAKVDSNHNESLTKDKKIIELEDAIKPSSKQVKAFATYQPTVDLHMKKKSHQGNLASNLMSLSSKDRVISLCELSKSEALQLIDDINQSISMNLEQDIADVVAIIKEKNLPLEAIISKLKVA